MKKIFKIIFILLCIALIIKLFIVLVLPPEKELEDFDPSPTIRVLLKSKINTAYFKFSDSTFNLWLPDAQRPYVMSSDKLTIEYHKGEFKINSFTHKCDWLEVEPKQSGFNFDNNLYPGKLRIVSTDDKHFDVVNYVELEPYVAKVVEGELSSHWPLETLKAQAIAARTYAVYHMETRTSKHFDLYASSRSQAYSTQKASYRSLLATLDTQRIILTQNNKTFLTYYISTCGGSTFSFQTRSLKSIGVKCEHCKDSPHYSWEYAINLDIIEKIYHEQLKGVKIKKIFLEQNNSGKSETITIQSKLQETFKISALSFRRTINQKVKDINIKSLKFNLDINNNKLVIKGFGWGYHGIGMCQFGAKKLGNLQYTCLDILQFYYPDTEIAHLNWEEDHS